MSSNRTEEIQIARRYASALFALAAQAASQPVVVAEFQALAKAISANADLAEALASPLVSNAQKSEVLAALVRGAHPLTARGLEVLADAGRAALIPTLASQLRDMLAQAQGELEAVVTSARTLPVPTQHQLAQALANATGKKVTLALKEDAALLGGVMIELGSLRLDASLSGALSQMRQQLLATGS